MTFKSRFLDYEPIRRGRPGKAFPSKSETDESSDKTFTVDSTVERSEPHLKSRPAGESTLSDLKDQPTDLLDLPANDLSIGEINDSEISRRSSTTTLSASSRASKENWIHRNGHSLSFVGLFLFTFVVYFRPYEWTHALSWLSSSAFWIAVFTIAVFVPSQLSLEGNLTARPREVNLVLLLTLTALLSIPLALNPSKAWDSFVEYLKVVAMFIVMVNVVRTEKRFKALLSLVLIASCVLSLAAIADYASGTLALKGDRIEGAIGGLFDNPNDLALHLVTMVPISIVSALISRNLLKKLIYASLAILFICGIVATFSRGGFLGLFVALTVLSWKLVRRNRALFAIGGAVLLATAIILAPGAYKNRIATTNDDSAIARTDDLKRSLFIAMRHPLAGVGMSNYILYSNVSKETHNAYTQVAAELGLAAVIFYICFIVMPLKSLQKIERGRNKKIPRDASSYLAIGLQASLIGFMVSSFFASVAYQWYVYYLVAYSICLRRLTLVEMNPKLKPHPEQSS